MKVELRNLENEETESNKKEHSRVDELKDLLGDNVVLIPVERGTKKPMIKEWNKMTLPDTQTQQYTVLLNENNIAVLVGSASGGLCSIDIDSDEELENFSQLNSHLFPTFITRGERGANIWVR